MSVASRSAGIGVVAVVLGLSLAGPQAVAVADEPAAADLITALRIAHRRTPLQLMNSATDDGKGVRILSAYEIGFLKDLGFTIAQPVSSV